jgi:hypothetical protein
MANQIFQRNYQLEEIMKERNCRSKQWGKFTCTLNENVMTMKGTENRLVIAGKKTSETLLVPDWLLPDARRAMRKGGGDRILDGIARDCIVYNAALKAHRNRNRSG